MASGSSALLRARLGPFFKGRSEVVFAYLFGSISRGTAGELSDIDLAVFIGPPGLPQTGNYGYQSDLSVELQALLEKEVDLVLLNDASAALRYRVLRDGCLIFCRSEKERRLFHERAVMQYLDLQPLLRVQRHYLHKRLAEGVFGGGSGGG